MKNKKIVNGLTVPKQYTAKRRVERKIRDERAKQHLKDTVRVKSVSNAVRIPFRVDEWNKKLIVKVKENKLTDNKYQYLIDMIGGVDNLAIYIKWYKEGKKTEQQLTSIHLRDIKVIINNDKRNNTK